MNEELRRLKERMSGLSNEELLKIVNVEFRDYRSEALEFAKAELDTRGLAYRGREPMKRAVDSQDPDYAGEDQGGQSDQNEDAESDQGDFAEFKPSFCIVCGAQARRGYLFGGSGEMTVVLSDNNEERFVELDACPKCGHVRLIVDFETDVAG